MIKRTIIEEYRELTEDIAVIKLCITSCERDIKKTINTYQPSDLGAINYDKPCVQSSNSQESISLVLIKLHDLQEELQDLQDELQSLYKQRDDLERTINDLGDVEKKAMMLRIKGLSNWKIAKEMNYSVRGIEEIFKRIYKKQKECGESVV
jgi:FtsZ-binding cell division protein ZapB